MKKILWAFLILLLLFAGIIYYLNPIIERIANDNIKYLLDQNDPTRLYDYSFTEIKLNIWNGDLQIKGVKVCPRKTVVDSFAQAGHPKRFLLEGHLNDIRVKGLDMIRFLTEKEVSIDSFIIENPVLRVLVDPSVLPDTSGPALSKDLLSQNVTYGSINFLLLKNASIRWTQSCKDSNNYFSCDSVSLLVKDLLTDSIMIKSKQTVKFSEFIFKGRNFDVGFIKDVILTAKGIDFCYTKNKLTLSQVIFRNEDNKRKFTKEQRFEKAWYNLKIDTVTIDSKDIGRWGYSDYLKIDKAILIKPIVVVYKDKRKIDPPFHVKPLPGKLIQDIELPLLIDTIEIKNGTATYEEIVENGKLPGRIFFTRINLHAYNLTNVRSVLDRRPSFIVNGTTSFLNRSTIVLHLEFPVLDPHQTFYAKGHITNVKATDLNNIVNNMAYAEFIAGDIHRVSFDMVGDEESSHGTIQADYSDLKIALLDTASVNKHRAHFEKRLMGLLANAMVRTNNVEGTKHYKEGHIHLLRPKNKFVLNYIWNSIKVGLITIALDHRLSQKLVEKTNEKIKEKEMRQ